MMPFSLVKNTQPKVCNNQISKGLRHMAIWVMPTRGLGCGKYYFDLGMLVTFGISAIRAAWGTGLGCIKKVCPSKVDKPRAELSYSDPS